LEELLHIAQELKAGRPVPSITIREFLTLFEAKRRGFFVVQNIREKLEGAGLATSPDFEEPGWIETPINFILKTKDPEQPERAETPDMNDTMGSAAAEAGDPQYTFEDTSYRVDQLKVANQKIISVKPDWLINQVVTLMLFRNVSQVPVMPNERDVKGIITWKSIGAKSSFGGTGRYARDFVEEHHEVRSDSSLFKAIPFITTYDYVLVRAPDRRISGIVTSSDLSIEFRDRTEPFLLLSEIENWIRNIIRQRFTPQELSAVFEKTPDNADVSNMTFGEYLLLLQNPDRWTQLRLNIDREIFCERLGVVKEIRNDVMHFKFRTKGEDIDSLREFSSFLATLSRIFKTE
jgi:hypothetical protein